MSLSSALPLPLSADDQAPGRHRPRWAFWRSPEGQPPWAQPALLGIAAVAFGIIRDEFPADKVAGAVGALASLTAVGAGLGIVLAGPIVNALDYHWLFWLPMILTIAAAVSAVIFVPESPVRTPGRISWLPAVLLSAWLVALLVALSEAPDWGWASGRILGLLAGAVLLAAAWVAAELRAATPLIDMKMMRRTAVWTNNLVSLLLGVGMYATFAFLPEFVQTPAIAGYGFGASITRSGLMLLPSAITMFIVGMFAGRLAARLGGKVLVIAGCLTGAAALASIVTSHLAPSGLPRESGYTTGFAVMAGGLVLAALAGLLIPAARRLRQGAGAPRPNAMALAADSAVPGGDSE